MRVFLNLILVLVVTVVIPLSAQSQSNHLLPSGLNKMVYNTIPHTVLPSYHSNRLSNTGPKDPYVAYNFKTDFNPDNSGTWLTLSASESTWFIKIQSRNALGLAVVFSDVRLLPGEKLHVYNQQGISGSFAARDIPPSGILPVNFVKGDEIVIEYSIPGNVSKHGSFKIESISHAFESVFFSEDNCHYDVQCEDGVYWQNEKRAVVRMTIIVEGGAKLCTGTLINNTAEDQAPYVITAQHCISSQEEAERTIFTFNYESMSCADKQAFTSMELQGSEFKAALYKNDFSLIKLYNHPPPEFRAYYAGWDIADQNLNYVACIHHPGGNPKKISLYKHTVHPGDFNDGNSRAEDGFWNIIKWDVGVTEGGSSGAPLINREHKLIGTLTGGSSECGSPYNDYFERLSQSWEAGPAPDQQLKYWLDPLNSGVKSLDGLDPFAGVAASCDSLSNILPTDIVGLNAYTPGDGYFSGYNSDNIDTYAEKFSQPDSVQLTGTSLLVNQVNSTAYGGLTVTVYADDNGGFPGTVLHQTYVPYSRLYNDLSAYVEFYPYVNVKGNFFIGYTMSYSAQDTFALYQTQWRAQASNTSFANVSGNWIPIADIAPGNAGSSLGIFVRACKLSVREEPVLPLAFYPNPASSVLVVNAPSEENSNVEIIDLQGKIHPLGHFKIDKQVVVEVSTLSTGMYILRVTSGGKIYQTKFVKR